MSNIIAKAYADALFQLSKSENCLDIVYKELQIVDRIVDKKVFIFLSSPIINKQDKIKVIQEGFNDMNIYLFSFLKILIQKNRFLSFKSIKKSFDSYYYEEKGILEAYIYSATELSELQINKIIAIFEQKYNKKIAVHFVKDDSLIAGVKVQINDDVYDNTLVNQLRILKEKI